jgi:diguanylate cyclase (GGDEF)-like protein
MTIEGKGADSNTTEGPVEEGTGGNQDPSDLQKEIDRLKVENLQLIQENEELAIENSRLIEENRRINEELKQAKEMSGTDFLTGIKNRKGLSDALYIFSDDVQRAGETVEETESKKSEFLQKNGVLVMADINDFKIINDTLGHPKGDEILKKVSKLFNECFRGTDDKSRLVEEENEEEEKKEASQSRYGGDEFLILLPPNERTEGKIVTQEEIVTVLENRLLNLLSKEEYKDFTLSVSILSFNIGDLLQSVQFSENESRREIVKKQIEKIIEGPLDKKLYEAKALAEDKRTNSIKPNTILTGTVNFAELKDVSQSPQPNSPLSEVQP